MNNKTEVVALFLAKKTGLTFTESQLSALALFLEGRFAAQGLNGPEQYLAQLEQPEEFRSVIDCVTVAETYFYRYPAQFEAFIANLLPATLALTGAKRPVRVWCAGCCTGEEPYTIALLAAEAGYLDRLQITATDINEAYLEAAAAGKYSPRSVEKLPAALLAKYFRREGDAFLLSEEICRQVSFRYLNLADASYPSFLNGTAGVDLIFCRNVLIYFDKARVKEIMLRFSSCLADGGLLALGHSEMLPRDWPFTVSTLGEAFFYRPAQAPASDASPPPGPVAAALKPVPRVRPETAPAAGGGAAETLILKAENLADSGAEAGAAALCAEIIRQNPAAVRAHYLLGLLELSRPEKALEHFRRVVYLDGANLQARLHLAQCQEKLGREGVAEREYRNLQRLAAARPPGEVLDAVEGITCGLLALIAGNALKKYSGSSDDKRKPK
ncbi:MAG TPA: hypothetical protein DCS63_02200 [Elusimicrobia bacterium]|nr:hypothetical protein [Elusimicrobiota bacterium]